MTSAESFERERERLVVLATRVLGDRGDAEDAVQQAWLRLAGTGEEIRNLPAWLTTVVTRLCLDRLRSHAPVPVPVEELPTAATPDVADEVVVAESVGVALTVVLDRLTPAERVAFVLHDTFGYDFGLVAEVLATTPTAARKLASRARAKVRQPTPPDALADWEVVDAFLAAARGGDLSRLLSLLAPEVVVRADDAARAAGTPAAVDGRQAVAAFFDGSARAALPVAVDGRPGLAWFQRGQARVLFDLSVSGGQITRIVFRADPTLLSRVVRRDGPVTSAGSGSSKEQERPEEER